MLVLLPLSTGDHSCAPALKCQLELNFLPPLLFHPTSCNWMEAFLRFIFYFMHMSVCLHVHHMHSWCLRKPEEGFRAPGIDIRKGYKTLCWGQELKPRSSAGAASAPNQYAIFLATACEVQSSSWEVWEAREMGSSKSSSAM